LRELIESNEIIISSILERQQCNKGRFKKLHIDIGQVGREFIYCGFKNLKNTAKRIAQLLLKIFDIP
jgi:hypothetical protein